MSWECYVVKYSVPGINLLKSSIYKCSGFFCAFCCIILKAVLAERGVECNMEGNDGAKISEP